MRGGSLHLVSLVFPNEVGLLTSAATTLWIRSLSVDSDAAPKPPFVLVECHSAQGASNSTPTKEPQGKTCFVTGGTRGIGRATALVLAEHGADIVFNYHQSTDLADEVCERAKKLGVRAKGYRADIAN